jgi:hypothetical protein
MENEIIRQIESLKTENEELKIDLEVAEENLKLFKAKAARVLKLEAEVKTLRAEVLLLLAGREKILKSL